MRSMASKKRSFFRYIIGFFGVFIALQGIILFAIVSFSQHVIAEREHRNARSILDVYDGNIRSALTSADASLSALIFDTASMKLLSNPSPLSRYHAEYTLLQAMQTRISNDKELDALIIANKRHGSLLSVRSSRVSYRMSQLFQGFADSLYQNAEIQNSGWKVVKIGGEPLMCHFYYAKDNIICALIKLSTMGSLYKPFFNEAQMLIMTDPQGELWTQLGGNSRIRLQYPLRLSLDGTQITDGYAITSTSVADGQVLLSFVAVPGSLGIEQAGGVVIFITGIVALLFALCFILYCRKEIITPMRVMIEAIQIIEKGDLNHRPRVRCRNDEFKSLALAFSGMLDQILHLRIASYERIIEYKDMELKYRAMQIRPHFFLNALSNLHSTCYKSGNVKACTFIDALTQNIRYMFKAGLHTVSVGEEIAHIENYLACQGILYPDCVFWHISVAEEAQGWQIPQMMLHTFVENIFKHVISPDSLTTVLIHAAIAERDGRRMARITVEDDGQGFPEQILKALSGDGEPAGLPDEHHIGLISIARTLQLLYGEPNLLELCNKPSGGAMVSAYIPEHTQLNPQGGIEAP